MCKLDQHIFSLWESLFEFELTENDYVALFAKNLTIRENSTGLQSEEYIHCFPCFSENITPRSSGQCHLLQAKYFIR